MDRTKIFRLAAAILLLAALPLAAAVIETKSITRTDEAIVLTGNDLSDYIGLAVNSTDPTLSPNQIFVWANDGGTWRQVIFQIDEVNNTYPNSPGPDYYDCDTAAWVSRGGVGTNFFEADDGLWDTNDQLVFMIRDLGDRLSQDEWPTGASTSYNRYEIAVEDPLNPGERGWAYVYVHETLPAWRTDGYTAWNEDYNTLSAWGYTLDYPDADDHAWFFQDLAITANLGGPGSDLLERQRLNSRFDFGSFWNNNTMRYENQIRTQFHLNCGSANTEGDAPWLQKVGRVRVVRYYWESPDDGLGYTGPHPWKPKHNVFYYATYWRQNTWANMTCTTCAGKVDWYRPYLDRTTGLVFDFYTSNADNVLIDGNTESLATTPTWTWTQSSSAQGSFIKLFPDSYIVGTNPVNHYQDDGSTNGESGYNLTAPLASAWHIFHYFMRPPNEPNVGQDYDDIVDNPATVTETSQAQASTPAFAGIEGAVDLNGGCADDGVELTWSSPSNWNDGCSTPCSNRHFEIWRNGGKIYDLYDDTATSWTDTTGNDGQTYDYGVEACNESDVCTTLGSTLPAMDYVSSAPTLADATLTAADADACLGDGIQLTWAAAADWNDDGEGTPRYDLYWDGDAYAAPIASDVNSPYVYDAPDGESHQYLIRAVNGCGDTADYDLSAVVADDTSTNPALPADPSTVVVDLIGCSLSGLEISWNDIADWGGNGTGTPRYDVYWGDDGFTTPIFTDATAPVVHAPGDSGVHTYRVVAVNGCDLSSNYNDGAGADLADGAPGFLGVQSVTDGDLCTDSILTISWIDLDGDDAAGWNDGGAGGGSRIYHIYRDGGEIAGSPVPDGTSSITDDPPGVNLPYTYVVEAVNLQGCYTSGGVSLQGTDNEALAPAAALAQTDAADDTCDAGDGVTVTWDPVTDWGDWGQSPELRRYRIYWSQDGYAFPIGGTDAATTTWAHDPPDDWPVKYRVAATNGCNLSVPYAESGSVIDKYTCAPPCTLLVDNDIDTANDFAETCVGTSFWSVQAGAGQGGSDAWVATLDGLLNETSAIALTSPQNITWTEDVKIRFWTATDLELDDAGVVELWSDDLGTWVKLETVGYPNPNADVPLAIDDICADGTAPGVQAAYQGPVAGYYSEARLDPYLTLSSTQVSVRYKTASGPTNTGASNQAVDDFMLGYGITDPVYFWSKSNDFLQGAVKSGTDAIFTWQDDGAYTVEEFRIYRSENPADIRTDATSQLRHQEPDTDAQDYSWSETANPPSGTCWYYRIYGYKEPCGESNDGEN